ncbi:Conserved hypothetical protein [Candidatus Phytoplasma australiense]|uniref:Peptidase M41 domain-containing protein n=1 Tax=Phytoplasma australiense TaxID=59748 RepID=B1V9L1_PHYAS|nr:Conserved hypothetical protein [Candidatus Phytoplasma australiense]
MAQENLIDESLVGSGCDSDFEKARELLQKNSANLRKDFDLFAEEAKNLISLNKETLKQIAKRLMIEKVLNHKELKEICQQYPLKGINNPQPTFTK